jgi:CcmD family protein
MKRIVLFIVAFALLPGVMLAAQQPAPSGAGPQDFVPLSALPQAEQLPAAPLLIGAYAFVWVALMAYVWSLWRRMSRLERELADLQRRVQQR